MLPSAGALELHWWRSLWVAHLWNQADKQHVEPNNIVESGWEIEEDTGQLKTVWDTPENIATITERVSLLTRGCGCKTGCGSKCCAFAMKGQYCGPGCKCVQCGNVESQSTTSDTEENLQLEEEIDDVRERHEIERNLETVEHDSDSCELDADVPREFDEEETSSSDSLSPSVY